MKKKKKFNNNYVDISQISNNIVKFLQFDYDLNLLERIENDKPITKNEYIYFECVLPVKLMCLKSLISKERSEKNV